MPRSLLPLLPLLGILGYFVVGLGVFALRSRFGRELVDEEVATRPASRLLGRFLRNYLMWIIRPGERALVRLGVSPTAVTLASLAIAVAGAAALANGAFALGGWLYLLAGILDILDGRVARATGRVTRAGAYLDSVVDRYAELAVFGGLAIYYRGSWVLGLVLAAAAGSLMVSYARARGEALGVDVRVGTMQRPERLFYLGVVVAHSPLVQLLVGPADPHPRYLPVVIALLALAVSTNVTAVRRILHTMAHLQARTLVADPVAHPAAAPSPAPLTRREKSQRLLNLLRTAG